MRLVDKKNSRLSLGKSNKSTSEKAAYEVLKTVLTLQCISISENDINFKPLVF